MRLPDSADQEHPLALVAVPGGTRREREVLPKVVGDTHSGKVVPGVVQIVEARVEYPDRTGSDLVDHHVSDLGPLHVQRTSVASARRPGEEARPLERGHRHVLAQGLVEGQVRPAPGSALEVAGRQSDEAVVRGGGLLGVHLAELAPGDEPGLLVLESGLHPEPAPHQIDGGRDTRGDRAVARTDRDGLELPVALLGLLR